MIERAKLNRMKQFTIVLLQHSIEADQLVKSERSIKLNDTLYHEIFKVNQGPLTISEF